MSISSSFPAEIATSSTPNHWPEWFRKDQYEAWELFESLRQPKRTDEPWRFANLKAIDLSDFHAAVPVWDAASLITRSSAHTSLAAKLIFANEVLIHNDQAELPAGVLLLPLEEAAKNHEELFRKSFMTSEVRLGSKKFAALHRAHLRSGAFVYVPQGVVIEKPIEIWHWVEGENVTIFPHTLIVLGEGASCLLYTSDAADE